SSSASKAKPTRVGVLKNSDPGLSQKLLRNEVRRQLSPDLHLCGLGSRGSASNCTYALSVATKRASEGVLLRLRPQAFAYQLLIPLRRDFVVRQLRLRS